MNESESSSGAPEGAKCGFQRPELSFDARESHVPSAGKSCSSAGSSFCASSAAHLCWRRIANDEALVVFEKAGLRARAELFELLSAGSDNRCEEDERGGE